MNDKMTIIGEGGNPRFVLDGNKITDLLHCTCEKKHPGYKYGEQSVCLVCGKPINEEP